MFTLSSTSSPLTDVENCTQINPSLAMLSFIKLLQNWQKSAVLNMAVCSGAIWRRINNCNMDAQLSVPLVQKKIQRCLGIFIFYMTFGAHKLVRSKPFLDSTHEIWQLMPVLYSNLRKTFLYRCTSTFQALNNCCGISLKSFRYLNKVGRTNFSPIFELFAISDRSFVNIVAPSSDENEDYVVHLKGRSLLRKRVKTPLKLAHEPWHNTCSNYAPSNEQQASLGVRQTKNKK